MKVIIGVGTHYREDEAAGPFAAGLLKKKAPAWVRVMEYYAECNVLHEKWGPEDQVFIIAAMRSGLKPGSIQVFDAIDPSRLADNFKVVVPGHTGIKEGIEVARNSGKLPKSLTVYGVEGSSFDAGEKISSAVKKAGRNLANEMAEKLWGGGRKAVMSRVISWAVPLVALLGLGGFVWWNNFLKKPPSADVCRYDMESFFRNWATLWEFKTGEAIRYKEGWRDYCSVWYQGKIRLDGGFEKAVKQYKATLIPPKQVSIRNDPFYEDSMDKMPPGWKQVVWLAMQESTAFETVLRHKNDDIVVIEGCLTYVYLNGDWLLVEIGPRATWDNLKQKAGNPGKARANLQSR
jgi:hydrogenase maturation protease